ncbi:hypothetical protein JCM5296_004216 [Sporobolomyces johnsonii]
MNKLKNILSHEENKSPSGHFTTENDSSDAPRRSSTSETTTTSQRSTGERAATAAGTALSSTSAGDRSATTAGTTAGTTPSSTSTGERTATNVATPSTTTGKVGNAVEHITEHARPPHHHHAQPKRDSVLDEADAKAATHDHQHLAPVTHEVHQRHEIEEIERQREIDRHVHHVQHHTQPVLDTQHSAEVHHEKIVPETHIRENHVATDEDKAMFASLKTAKDTVTEAPREKTIIDKGEQVVENVSHHVHHVVQPVIERDTHEHHRIHTVIPVHQRVEEAPIVHASVQHEPMSLKDFTAGGGDLSSTLKHDPEALLRTSGECSREVDGPAETLVQQLGLASINDKTTATSTTPATTRV